MPARTAAISKIGRVCVTVSDTERALAFYAGALGFEKVVDVPMGEGQRWVELAIPTGHGNEETTIALAPPPPGRPAGGSQTGICLDTDDAHAARAALEAAGADVDVEVSLMGEPVPPMFWVRDPDGNSLIVVQVTG